MYLVYLVLYVYLVKFVYLSNSHFLFLLPSTTKNRVLANELGARGCSDRFAESRGWIVEFSRI